MSHASFTDPETHFEIITSDSPVTVDGYALGEPKQLRCEECGATVILTEQPTPGVDELQHRKDCSQRWTRSQWWAEHFDRS
ncbi:MAG: hypothetical protein ACOCUO_02080 [archaeon]